MMTLEMFKDACKLTKLDILKGKGREYASTPIGTVYAAKDLNWDKVVYVTKAGDDLKTSTGESLKGTYWFVNSAVQITRSV
jgi:hypothetical protein